MFKKTIAISSAITILSFSFAMPLFAQTSGGGSGCGFWGNLLGLCSKISVETQSANAINSELGSNSKHTEGLRTEGLRGAITPAQIACVGSSVAIREASLDAGMTTFSQAINSAYSTRATDLATAYAQTTTTAVKAGIKTAWKTFNSSTRNAQKAWRTTQNGAWSTFRSAVKSCVGAGSLNDSANSVTEMSGE